MIQMEGRTLNPEKIMFKNTTQLAGQEADWSRHAVKEKVISAVSVLTLSRLSQFKEAHLAASGPKG